MKTLLVIYKWQIALAAALFYIALPYFQTLANWLTVNPTARELIADSFITFALIAALGYIAFAVWNDQRPPKNSRKAAS